MSILFSFAQPLLRKQFSWEHLTNTRKVMFLKFMNQVKILPLLGDTFFCYWGFFLFIRFIYLLLRERERASSSESMHEQVGEGQREKQTPCLAGSWICGSSPGPQDHDLSGRQTLNWLSHPGAPAFGVSLLPFQITNKSQLIWELPNVFWFLRVSFSTLYFIH